MDISLNAVSNTAVKSAIVFDLSQQILCTPEQAMHALGCGRTTLYQYLADNAIRSVKLGKSRRIIVRSLHEFVADLESYCFGELKGKG